MLTWTAAKAPAATEGGRDVVKINPEPYDRTVSTRAAEAAMYPPTLPNAFPNVPVTMSMQSRALSRSPIPPVFKGQVRIFLLNLSLYTNETKQNGASKFFLAICLIRL